MTTNNKALINAAASLAALDSDPANWDGSGTTDPDTFHRVLQGLPEAIKTVQTLNKAGYIHSRTSTNIEQVAQWLDSMCKLVQGTFDEDTKKAIADLNLQDEEKNGNLIAVGVYFFVKAPAHSWLSHTDVEAVSAPMRKFIDITTATENVKIVDDSTRVQASYRVTFPETSVSFDVTISTDWTAAPEDEKEKEGWTGFVLPPNLTIDLDDKAFAPFLVGATCPQWEIIIAQCKGKFAISCDCPLTAEVATLVVAKTRGLCVGPVPDPDHFDFRGKPLKIELGCSGTTLLELYYNN